MGFQWQCQRGNSSYAPSQTPLPIRSWFQIPKPKATLFRVLRSCPHHSTWGPREPPFANDRSVMMWSLDVHSRQGIAICLPEKSDSRQVTLQASVRKVNFSLKIKQTKPKHLARHDSPCHPNWNLRIWDFKLNLLKANFTFSNYSKSLLDKTPRLSHLSMPSYTCGNRHSSSHLT